jgi:hypothetical protein
MRLEDYGLIGDMQTAALVGRDGASTAASMRRARCPSGCSASPTTSACFAEEYDVARRRQVGNFPQAFSHLTLILAARAISSAEAGASRAVR